MKTFLLLITVAIVSWTSVASAEISREKHQEIEKMLRLTGAEKQGEQLVNQMLHVMLTNMIPLLKLAEPDSSELEMKEELKKVQQKFRQKLDVRAFFEIDIVPIWDKYYSLDDLKTINAFYETPAGKRLLAVAPKAGAEVMQAALAWGTRIGKEVAEEIDRETPVTSQPQPR